MKICYLTNNISPGSGWGRYASDLIYGIRGAGHDVTILKEEDDGLEGFPVLKKGFGIFHSALRVRRFLNDVDIIHALDGYPYGIIGALANLGLGKKIIITGVGTYAVEPLYNSRVSWLLSWSYKKANKVMAISSYTQKKMSEKLGIEVGVINPGLDFKKFHRGHLETSENFILSVGALKPRKGYHVSIVAFASAKKDFPDLRYKIVGSQNDKKYLEKLKELVAKHKIEKDVEFLENVSDEELKKLYQTAKLFVLASINNAHQFEGYGLVFLEAAAAGLPVIGTLGNGIEDAVKDGYNGVLVDQNNIEGTTRAITSLLGSDKRSTMIENSYNWAKQNDIEPMINKYLELYKTL